MQVSVQTPGSVSRPIRLVALFEGFKGILVLVAGSGLLLMVHKDVNALAVQIIAHSHLNPASRYPEIFLEFAGRVQDGRLQLLALGAAVYAAIRLFEAYGLYHGRAWAEVLAAASGAIYIPLEVMELLRHVTVLRVILLLANIAVVGIMIRALVLRRKDSSRNATEP